jgi:hypothetical protein
MRLWSLAAVTTAGIITATAACAQTGGAYDLGWHAVTDGAATTGGGPYVLKGLSGQPAMVSHGNAYTLNAGFYGAALQLLVAVPPKPSLPKRYALYAPSPNPSAAGANVTFDLPRATPVALRLYDVNGRVVRRLAEGSRDAGQYHVAWDGRTESGAVAQPGIYLLDFHAGAFRATRRIVHL